MRVLDKVDIMVRLKEKIYEAKLTADTELVNRLELLLDEVMQNPAMVAV